MNNITILEAKPSMAEDLLLLNNMLDNETEFRAYKPGERKILPEEYALYLEEIRKSKNSNIFVAFDGVTPIGLLEANGRAFQRKSHVTHIVIGILKNYTGLGIGKHLFTRMEEWARDVGLVRLELTVFTYNTPAIKLYKKLGFLTEGTIKSSFKLNDKFVDEYLMAKILK